LHYTSAFDEWSRGRENAQHRLLPTLHALANALEAKGAEFELVVKVGRTHLQDAVPMTGA